MDQWIFIGVLKTRRKAARHGRRVKSIGESAEGGPAGSFCIVTSPVYKGARCESLIAF